MAASPHSQETVSRLFERNYVPVLWHPMRKYIGEIQCRVFGFEYRCFRHGVMTGIRGFCTAFARDLPNGFDARPGQASTKLALDPALRKL